MAPALEATATRESPALGRSPASEAPAPQIGAILSPLDSNADSTAPALPTRATPDGPLPGRSPASEAPVPQIGVILSPLDPMPGATAPAVSPRTTPDDRAVAKSATSQAPAPQADAILAPPVPIPRSTIVPGPAKGNLAPFSIPVGSILFYENFSHYREAEATDWGPNTSIKRGTDHRNWLLSNVHGTLPVGRRIWLPNKFYFECRFSAYMPELTRGIVGWWKDPVSTRFSFLNAQGGKYTIAWVINCGNDLTRLNPLGSSSLYAKKYYHSIKLPDGTAKEVGVVPSTGLLRIDRDDKNIKVFVDGQPTVIGSMTDLGQLAGFEIDIVNGKNGALFFTDFKIAR